MSRAIAHIRPKYYVCKTETLKAGQSNTSTFAQMVDKLRTKSEEELKVLYLRLFSNELKDEWKSITKKADFKKASEADIIKAIQKNRYRG